MEMNTASVRVSEQIDTIVDDLVEHAGDPDPLEERLQEVLVRAYKGRLLHFASDLNEALNAYACQCLELVTCDCLKKQALRWADAQLLIKATRPEPDEEEVF